MERVIVLIWLCSATLRGMTIQTDHLIWGVLCVLALWPVAGVCKAWLQFQRACLHHEQVLAAAREETIRLQALARALGASVAEAKPQFKVHPSMPPAPPRPPA